MEMEPGKLFIGGISWDTNEDHLKEYFQVFGEVVEAVIMKDRITGRARGFGFVVFADPAVAERVVRERHIIHGRTVEAKKAVPRDDQHMLNRNNGSLQGSPIPTRTKKIFVGGLASTVTDSDFKIYFDQFGTITDVVVMYDHDTQRPRGFGFITYDSEEAVEKVLLKTFHKLSGKMVEVKRALPKELSPGPSRSSLGVLNAYAQGYGRFSPVTIGPSDYTPFGPSGYAMGPKFESALNPSYGRNGNFNSGLNAFNNGSRNWYNSPIGYDRRSSGTGSVNMWGNGSFNYASSSENHNEVMGTRSGSSRLCGAFGCIGTLCEKRSSLLHSISSVAPTSSYGASSRDGLGGAFGNLYGSSSFYEDRAWHSSSPKLGSGILGYGLEKVASDVATNNSAKYVGGYAVTNRANGGIAA